ncbi:MAG: hypothetical protein COS94_01790 [Candidatus Hydrogenedentes bacterium CG07_land_8_20_14_0_80_42_17]|nr:MAG: hypothetical protein AUJ18_03445 [Candidatus Hydrogenedentes bacterium CG1_02_42_14]PIU48511.1 MAG: hypothetical protein COS94_01790 [Candidatus Hydrogenedentes bacterium CG07_land_8_20_14_0_80_42_17]
MRTKVNELRPPLSKRSSGRVGLKRAKKAGNNSAFSETQVRVRHEVQSLNPYFKTPLPRKHLDMVVEPENYWGDLTAAEMDRLRQILKGKI